uniref:Uncharacterized protein n=1 Tax=Cucumis melo TaxID=3656 RepID=A0A9I9CK00_CUCME
MGGHDLELERARLLSLAAKLGFDEESAEACLDRIINLYGNFFHFHPIPDPKIALSVSSI